MVKQAFPKTLSHAIPQEKSRLNYSSFARILNFESLVYVLVSRPVLFINSYL